MGQKSDPRALRLNTNREFDSNWYTDNTKDANLFVLEDEKIRRHFHSKYRNYGIDRIYISRVSKDSINIIVTTSRMGVLLGKKGEGIEKIRSELSKLVGRKVSVKAKDIPNNVLKARVLGLQIAEAIEKRTPFKKAMNYALSRARKANVQGIKITVSGRLNGAEIARSETVMNGKVPLHSLKYEIDYAKVEARTISGIIGIKVWICSGIREEAPNVNA